MSESEARQNDFLTTLIVDEPVARAFEEATADGIAPDLAALAARFPEERRGPVVTQLVVLDQIWRRKAGCEERNREGYLSLFPEFTAAVERALGSSPPSTSVGGTADEYRTTYQEVSPSAPTPKAPASSSTGLPPFIGVYQLLEKIGGGGMGVVYKARQPGVNRIIALKFIKNADHSPHERERFLREARAAGMLDHPNIVPVYECGEHEGNPYLTMAFIDGGSLKSLLQRGLPDPVDVMGWMIQIADGVAHAHAKGVVHRDLKPDNVLLGTDGRIRVTDFGLARLTEGGTDLTSDGQLLGTAGYMSPEQARGRKAEIGYHTDVYGLGATLYALLTGQAPFRASRLIDTLSLITSEPPVPPGQINPSVSEGLQAICLKCLEKSPSARFPGAEAVATALRELQRQPEPERTFPEVRGRSPWVTWGLAAGLSLFMTATIWLVLDALHAKGRTWTGRAHSPESVPGQDSLQTTPTRDQVAAGHAAHAEPEVSAPRDGNSLTTPVRVTTFEMFRYRDQADKSVLLGEIGTAMSHANVEDAVRVKVGFVRPAYAALVALNADGTSQWCWPEEQTDNTKPVLAFEYPASRDKAFYLTDGVGQQAFVLLVSVRPLMSRENLLANIRWEKHPPAEYGNVFLANGNTETERGTVKKLKSVQDLFGTCERLQQATAVDCVWAKGFPVRPVANP